MEIGPISPGESSGSGERNVLIRKIRIAESRLGMLISSKADLNKLGLKELKRELSLRLKWSKSEFHDDPIDVTIRTSEATKPPEVNRARPSGWGPTGKIANTPTGFWNEFFELLDETCYVAMQIGSVILLGIGAIIVAEMDAATCIGSRNPQECYEYVSKRTRQPKPTTFVAQMESPPKELKHPILANVAALVIWGSLFFRLYVEVEKQVNPRSTAMTPVSEKIDDGYDRGTRDFKHFWGMPSKEDTDDIQREAKKFERDVLKQLGFAND